MMNEFIFEAVNLIVQYATNYLMPILIVLFLLAVIARLFISVIVNRQKRFVDEFCKRVHSDIWNNPTPKGSFYNLVKSFLARTYFEIFELRAKYKRRNDDHVMTIGDRAFLVQDGIIMLIDDFLTHVRYLRKDISQAPNFKSISNNVFSSNPVFNKILGVVSLSRTNEILNILPGIFIVAGIFGTFLGIMKALPELTAMDITNAETSKVVIDSFLIKISFALTTSILGIVLSIIMSFLNTVMSPESTYLEIIDSFKSATDILWNKCETNDLVAPENMTTRETEAEDAFEMAISKMYSRRY